MWKCRNSLFFFCQLTNILEHTLFVWYVVVTCLGFDNHIFYAPLFFHKYFLKNWTFFKMKKKKKKKKKTISFSVEFCISLFVLVAYLQYNSLLLSPCFSLKTCVHIHKKKTQQSNSISPFGLRERKGSRVDLVQN